MNQLGIGSICRCVDTTGPAAYPRVALVAGGGAARVRYVDLCQEGGSIGPRGKRKFQKRGDGGAFVAEGTSGFSSGVCGRSTAGFIEASAGSKRRVSPDEGHDS